MKEKEGDFSAFLQMFYVYNE